MDLLSIYRYTFSAEGIWITQLRAAGATGQSRRAVLLLRGLFNDTGPLEDFLPGRSVGDELRK